MCKTATGISEATKCFEGKTRETGEQVSEQVGKTEWHNQQDIFPGQQDSH